MKCQAVRCQSPATGPTVHGRYLCTRCKLSVVVAAQMRATQPAEPSAPKPRNERPSARDAIGCTLTSGDVEALRGLLAFARRQGYVQTAAITRLTQCAERWRAAIEARK